jgi:hypothetical protein
MRVGLVAAGCVALSAAPARAQYVAPPPDPGFQYIFDGTTTAEELRSVSQVPE